MEMYRPEGWKEIKDAIHDKINIDDPYYEGEVDEGIEAGADAMLEGLKKEGIPDGEGGVYRLTHWLKPEEAKFETSFIPDEE